MIVPRSYLTTLAPMIDARRFFIPLLLPLAVAVGGCVSVRTPAAQGALLTSAVGTNQPRWPSTITDFPPGFLPETKLLEKTVLFKGLGKGTIGLQTPVSTRGSGVLMWDDVVVAAPTPISEQKSPSTTPGLQATWFTYYAFTDRSSIDRAISLRTPASADEPTDTFKREEQYRRTLDVAAASQLKMQFVLWPSNPARPTRGVVIYQFGLDGYRFENPLVKALRADGWTVLSNNGFSFKSGSRSVIPNGVRGAAQPKPPSRDETNIVAALAGAYAAAELDGVVGNYVLAYDTALGFVYSQQPELTSLPLVVMGSSLGSFTTPALVARLQESGTPPAASVMIGSGGNLLRILGTSWEDSWYSEVRGKRKMSVPARARPVMYAEYLRCTTLDPLARAAELRRQPLLMIHAAWDLIVPASTGDALWEAAGRPERWSVYAGHIPMFVTLRTRKQSIVDWVRTATDSAQAPGLRPE